VVYEEKAFQSGKHGYVQEPSLKLTKEATTHKVKCKNFTVQFL